VADQRPLLRPSHDDNTGYLSEDRMRSIWHLKGAIVAANEEFPRLLQYDREDVVSGRLRWTDMTPPELRERDERAVAELRSTGSFQPFE
jgi:PAS domain-containing protein